MFESTLKKCFFYENKGFEKVLLPVFINKFIDGMRDRTKKLKNTAGKNLEQKAKLASLLCRYYGFDQGIRNPELAGEIPDKLGFKIDSLNFSRAIEFIKKYGYPLKKDYGPYYKLECVQASIFAILLHSPRKIANNRKNFNLLLKQVKRGMSPKVIAIVMDKYLYANQIFHPEKETTGVLYTTSFGKPCLRYRHKSDSLRAKIGLPPLKKEDFKVCE